MASAMFKEIKDKTFSKDGGREYILKLKRFSQHEGEECKPKAIYLNYEYWK